MAYGMAGMPGNRYRAGLPRGMGGFPAVGGGLGGLPVRKSAASVAALKRMAASAGSSLTIASPGSGQDCEVVSINSTQAIALWNDAGIGYGCVLTVTNGELSKGATVSISGADSNFYHFNIARLSDTTAIISTRRGGSYCYVAVLTVSGTSLSVGSFYQVGTNAISAKSLVVGLTSSKAIVIYPNGVNADAHVLDVSGTSVTVGGALQVSNFSDSGAWDFPASIQRISDTQAVMSHKKYSSYSNYVYVLTASGSTVSKGTQYELAYSGQANMRLCVLSSSFGVVVYSIDSTNTGFRSFDISGSTLTFGSEAVNNYGTAQIEWITDASPIGPNQFVASFFGNSFANGYAAIVSLSEGAFVFDSAINFGAMPTSSVQASASSSYAISVSCNSTSLQAIAVNVL